jgi:4-amino-4-deoxy-L-arabinose transferase-like glycosyltransferase
VVAAAALLFAAALAVRIAYLAVVVGPRPPEGGWAAVTGDFRFFDVTGWHLASGKGYSIGDGSVPTAYMPPGYSMFIGAVYRVAGRSPEAVRVAQAALLALVAPLAFAYAAALASRRVGIIAGALAAMHPDFIYPVGRYQKENVFIPLLALFAIAATRLARGDAGEGGRRPSAGVAAAAGLLLAACALTRSEFVVAYAPIGAWLAGRQRDRRLPRVALAAFAVAALVPLAAWGARNHARLGEWIVTANGGGITLFRSLEEIAERAGVEAPRPPAPRGDGSWTERREDRDYFAAARAWIAAHSGACLAAVPRRLWAFWGFEPVGEVFRYGPVWTRLVGFVAYGALFPLWVAGLAIAWRERRGVGLFAALAVYFSLVAAVFTPSARIRAPITPFLVVFAALAIERLVARVPAGRGARRGAAA